MDSSTLFLLVFLIYFHPFTPTMSQTLEQAFPQETCGAADFQYPNSINDLLSSISSRSINSGFLYNSTNQSSWEIELVGLCRGDLQDDGCFSCLKDSADRILQNCPSKSDAIVWSLNCTLRYSIQTLYGVLDISRTISFRSFGATTCSNESLYEQEFQNLLSNLQTKAAAGGSLSKVAAGKLSVDSDTSYVMVQCRPDLSEQQCQVCLDNIYQKNISASCDRTRQVIFNPSCNYRRDDHNFFDLSSPNPTTLLTAVPPTSETALPPPVSSGHGSFPWWAVLIIVAAALLGVLFCAAIKTKDYRLTLAIKKKDYELTFGKVKAATKNFKETRKLGQGGCGTVYMGELNGKKIAAKKLSSKDLEQGRLTFENEAKLLTELKHNNVVTLIGFCEEGEEKILVYEYMPNKSLDRFIFDSNERKSLAWETRYKIIQGIAEGLLYLHGHSREHDRIIHRDLKAPNILLDADMTPKIADFGISRLFKWEKTHLPTTAAAGTRGYVAPECREGRNLSDKTDVFSFGVLMLEIVTGQTVQERDLLNDAWNCLEPSDLSGFADKNLQIAHAQQILNCIHIALHCVQERNARPTMEGIIGFLRNGSRPDRKPTEPCVPRNSRD